jgi:tetratricopeptide (TPR) repeat protein
LESKGIGSDELYGVGINYMDSRKFEEVIECFEKAIELEPDNGNAYCKFGISIWAGRYDYKKAGECYKRQRS